MPDDQSIQEAVPTEEKTENTTIPTTGVNPEQSPSLRTPMDGSGETQVPNGDGSNETTDISTAIPTPITGSGDSAPQPQPTTDSDPTIHESDRTVVPRPIAMDISPNGDAVASGDNNRNSSATNGVQTDTAHQDTNPERANQATGSSNDFNKSSKNIPFQSAKRFIKRLKPIHYGLAFIIAAATFATVGATHINNSPSQSQNSGGYIATPSASISPVVCNATNVNPNDPQAFLPDPTCTPGATNSAVMQSNIQQTICVAGYTKTIRSQEPTSYFENLKIEQMGNYQFTDSIRNHEEDHLISLELGGSNSVYNLWPEPHATPNEKDSVENFLHKEVCAGIIPLATAQKEISTNWYQVFLSMPK